MSKRTRYAHGRPICWIGPDGLAAEAAGPSLPPGCGACIHSALSLAIHDDGFACRAAHARSHGLKAQTGRLARGGLRKRVWQAVGAGGTAREIASRLEMDMTSIRKTIRELVQAGRLSRSKVRTASRSWAYRYRRS